jgi:preprotein translocase subunit Sss1
MASLQQQIADKFLAALARRKDVDAQTVVELRQLLSRGKKPKADEFIRVFTAPPGGEVK